MTPAREFAPLPVPLTPDGLTRWLSDTRRRAAELEVLAAHGAERERSLACQHLGAALEDTLDALATVGVALRVESDQVIALARELRHGEAGPST